MKDKIALFHGCDGTAVELHAVARDHLTARLAYGLAVYLYPPRGYIFFDLTARSRAAHSQISVKADVFLTHRPAHSPLPRTKPLRRQWRKAPRPLRTPRAALPASAAR
ncbi:hypothetical protein SDC9_144757 [bioreactor metagenome]|uniref:Uncharacterized protein n=1 Tax=bioreactor metagenome TaxID=1076179 RepID=A0A645EAD4_9ZZZZ